MIASKGEKAAAAWLAGLKQNARVYQDEEAVVAAVNRGRRGDRDRQPVLLVPPAARAGREAHQEPPLLLPGGDPGSVVNISGAAVLASSKHQAEAEQFVAFLVSPAGQQLIASGDDFEYPVRPGIAPNAALPPLAQVPHTTFSVVKLGDDREAAQLIASTGFGA